MDDAPREAINKLRSECLSLRQRTEDLRRELDKQENSRRYLLAEKTRSKDPTPVVSPAASPVPPSNRGKKRSIRERRGEQDPVPRNGRDLSPPLRHMRFDPFIPEIVMESPARRKVEPPCERSLSPMARYAAADPQVMGVLRDIVGSLRGLERHTTAPEGRPGPAPAAGQGREGADAAPAPGAPVKKTRRRKRRKKDRPPIRRQ